ncbi:nitroreductase/quinone reductase family protein [Occultella kanbiaonis]|uniref:nitroreductase/quinone reductase family protein n=1 Tax=Occultella kanbiaonis TaxID=2675754 RepID=UPI00157FF879|nr:nitroreductase/quinone reductase family protein [Occultella kanbiaonis]
MTFNTPNGTYGISLPPAEELHARNEPTIATIREGGSTPGMQTLVLITRGKKSGLERENPVAYFPLSDESWLILASAGGATKHPSWYFNLAAHPDEARVVLAGEEFPVAAEELHGPEREHHWQEITAAAPGFAEYATRTDRTIPVIRLTGRAA